MAHDVIVVGARCAGASVARLLAAAGIRVLLIDRSRFPSDTISTHCITLSGLRQLSRWELLEKVRATSAPLVRSLNLEIRNEQKPHFFGRGQGAWTLSPRRLALDSVLIEEASNAGATVWQGTTVTHAVIDQGGGIRVAGQHESGAHFEEAAAILVGADGRNSTVARSIGAPVEVSQPSRLLGWYAYYSGMDSGATSWAFGDSASAGVFPTNDGLACVWAMLAADRLPRGAGDRQEFFLSALRASSDRIHEEVCSGRPASPITSFGAYPSFIRSNFGPAWALMGDASQATHPIIAHGISDAFRDARLLTEAIRSSLSGDQTWHDACQIYAKRQRAATRMVFDATHQIAAQSWSASEIMDLLDSYKAGVRAALSLEDEWWGPCDLTSIT